MTVRFVFFSLPSLSVLFVVQLHHVLILGCHILLFLPPAACITELVLVPCSGCTNTGSSQSHLKRLWFIWVCFFLHPSFKGYIWGGGMYWLGLGQDCGLHLLYLWMWWAGSDKSLNLFLSESQQKLGNILLFITNYLWYVIQTRKLVSQWCCYVISITVSLFSST